MNSITRRPTYWALRLLLASCSLSVLAAIGCEHAGGNTPTRLSEDVRPGGGWLAASTAPATQPLFPDTRFMGFSDEQEVRFDRPGSPLNGLLSLSRVMETDLSSYRAAKQAGRVTAERDTGRQVYWAVESEDAYVFPDSTRLKPHTVAYRKTERVRATRFSDDELRQLEHERRTQAASALRQYRRADAALELRLAWEHGDRRFVGVMGYGLIVPGAEDRQDLIEKCGVKVIPHTSDCPADREESEFQQVAARFARAYNALLAERLGKEPLP